jgi:hypothetical protein
VQINHGTNWCISFGGLKPDRDVAAEILRAVEGNAIEAALEVAARAAEQQSQRHRALSSPKELAAPYRSPLVLLNLSKPFKAAHVRLGAQLRL